MAITISKDSIPDMELDKFVNKLHKPGVVSCPPLDSREWYGWMNRELFVPFYKDVRVIDSNGTKVTIIDFGDGTFEKAVCHKDDTYSLEQGISICVTKKILSELTGLNGTTAYNKLIRKALKVMKNNRKAEEKAKQESTAEELRRKKAAEKRQKRLAKIVERKRKEQIEIQEEAYLRAMKKYNLCFGDED